MSEATPEQREAAYARMREVQAQLWADGMKQGHSLSFEEMLRIQVIDGICTCGSGAHPRLCLRHPWGYRLHVTDMNLEYAKEEINEAVCKLRPDDPDDWNLDDAAQDCMSELEKLRSEIKRLQMENSGLLEEIGSLSDENSRLREELDGEQEW